MFQLSSVGRRSASPSTMGPLPPETPEHKEKTVSYNRSECYWKPQGYSLGRAPLSAASMSRCITLSLPLHLCFSILLAQLTCRFGLTFSCRVGFLMLATNWSVATLPPHPQWRAGKLAWGFQGAHPQHHRRGRPPTESNIYDKNPT